MPTPTRVSSYLSEQLALAMAKTRQPDGTAWTDSAVADAVEASGYDKTSRHYIAALRKGARNNPRQGLVEALGRVFDLPSQWFVEEDDRVERVMRDLLDPSRSVALHDLRRLVAAAAQLDPDNLARVTQLAATLLESQQLSAALPPSRAPQPAPS